MRSTLEFIAALVAGLLLVALAFFAVFELGWFIVHVIGRALLHFLPAPIAYLATAVGAALAVYACLFVLPGAIKRAFRWATGRHAPRETSRD